MTLSLFPFYSFSVSSVYCFFIPRLMTLFCLGYKKKTVELAKNFGNLKT